MGRWCKEVRDWKLRQKREGEGTKPLLAEDVSGSPASSSESKLSKDSENQPEMEGMAPEQPLPGTGRSAHTWAKWSPLGG